MNRQTSRQLSRPALLTTILLLISIAFTGCSAPMAGAPTASPSLSYEAAPAAPEPVTYSTGGSAPVNDAAYDATFFQNYGVNPFLDTEDDHLSTFAMDVDTASYTVARRYINDGNLPDPDSVRVEEFVNYFKMGYAPPAEGAFAIHLDAAPSPFGGPNYSLLRVGLQGQVIAAEDRKDASLVFVIDISGSMDQENRLELVKHTLRMLVDELRPTDQVAIVVYGDQAQTVLNPTGGEEKNTILRAIERLRPDGSTNAEEGLLLGYQVAASMQRPGRITRLILCSDGVANVGNTGPDSILAQVRGYVDEGISLSTVGYGMGNYNDVLMEQLADNGDGNYAYVDSLEEGRRFFVDNLTGALQTIAKDAKVQVDFNPAVVSRYRLLGYENRRVDDDDFRNDQVDAGEVGAGHSVTALYEIKLYEGDALAAEDALATVYVRYADPDTAEVREISQSLTRGQLAATFEESPADFRLLAAVAEYAEILRESYWAQDGDLGEVRRMAQQVSVELADHPTLSADAVEFAYLVTQAGRIADR